MAENEQQFRAEVLKQSQADDTADRRRGMYCGLTAFLSLVVGGVICAFLGHTVLAGSFTPQPWPAQALARAGRHHRPAGRGERTSGLR
jgi:hypothetical protein